MQCTLVGTLLKKKKKKEKKRKEKKDEADQNRSSVYEMNITYSVHTLYSAVGFKIESRAYSLSLRVDALRNLIHSQSRLSHLSITQEIQW